MQRYRVIAEKMNGSEVILAHTDSPDIARTIAEHLALTHRDYTSLAIQEHLRGQWRTISTFGGGGAALIVTVQIDDTLVRYGPA